ncbi:inositol monophosphatase family protein [Arboricoccus pini]|uniref:inositol monophosphatase family protein n=1 Tax=Arboricoccus pini TaxID=1963835 RepID=UPI0013FE22D4|nr:3'(2'),5'-bisphosphate nucleotidase CysQ [Arboricoccus pini]
MTIIDEGRDRSKDGVEINRVKDKARLAVQDAGRIAMTYFRQRFDHWEKSPGQIVTDADIAIDRFLHEALVDEANGDGWLSEETPDDHKRLDRRRVWVVDPIDGTRSFAAGLPEFTISVGLLVDGHPVLGFVFNPANGDFFEATAGQGAKLNGRPLHATWRQSLEGANIVVSSSENKSRHFADYMPGANLTTIGSLAYKLCLVAAGRYDGYLTWRRTHDWDIAAAVLVLEEAGGLISTPDGQPILLNRAEPWHEGLIAGGPALHQAVLDTTAKAYGHLRGHR